MLVKFSELEIYSKFIIPEHDIIAVKVNRNEGKLELTGIVCHFTPNEIVEIMDK